jgi:acyl-CoA thioester hydrolase
MYKYQRRVAYHETDAMGVAHHSNYIKFFEEARVSWLRDQKLIAIHAPQGPFTFAVVDLDCQYKKPCTFEDDLEIVVDARLDGIRIVFRYAIWHPRTNSWIATGRTTLVPLNAALRPARLPDDVRSAFSQGAALKDWPPQHSSLA